METEAVVATARSLTRSRCDAKEKHNQKGSKTMSTVTVAHKPAATNNGSDTDTHTLVIECLSGGVPFMADETEGDLVELSIIGNLEFDDFLKSVAAIRQKRIRAAQA